MNDIPQSVNNEADPNRFYAMIEHMADDDLDVYEYRLLGHYKRVCGVGGGKCTEGIRTTAQKCKMSIGQVSKTRKSLVKAGWIRVKVFDRQTEAGNKVIDGIAITLANRMTENIARYSNRGCSPDEQGVFTTRTGCSPHERKKNLDQEELTPSEEEPNKDQKITPPGAGGENLSDSQPPEWPPVTQPQLFGAICTALALDTAYLTSGRKKTIGKVATDLLEAKARPEDMPGFVEYLKKKLGWKDKGVSEKDMLELWPDYASELARRNMVMYINFDTPGMAELRRKRDLGWEGRTPEEIERLVAIGRQMDEGFARDRSG